MEYNKAISDLAVGDTVEGYYVLRAAQIKTSSSGRPFLAAVLADRSGAIDAKAWDYAGPVGAANEGQIVKLRGTVGEFRGALQLTIDRIRVRGANDVVDLSALVPVAPMDPDAALAAVTRLVASIADDDYRAVCTAMLARHEAAFRSIPAAKTVHHGFIGGLLMHTANMLRTADFLAGLYADTVDRSLLLAGTLLHDFAKESEFTFSSLGLVTDYSVKGELLGHLVMGAQEVAEVAAASGVPEEKSVLLQHMILSHHGDPAFGAAVRPMCAESELLSLIDQIDSRMEIYREALADLPAGKFSQKIFALDKKIYSHE